MAWRHSSAQTRYLRARITKQRSYCSRAKEHFGCKWFMLLSDFKLIISPAQRCQYRTWLKSFLVVWSGDKIIKRQELMRRHFQKRMWDCWPLLAGLCWWAMGGCGAALFLSSDWNSSLEVRRGDQRHQGHTFHSGASLYYVNFQHSDSSPLSLTGSTFVNSLVQQQFGD